MHVYNEKDIHALNDGNGGTVFAVNTGKGGFALTDHITISPRAKGNKVKRTAQKQARKQNRK